MIKEFWMTLSPWKKFKLIMSLILTIFAVIFAIMNWQEIEVNFIFFTIQISVTLLIMICLTVGYLFSTIFDYRKYRKKELEIKKLKAQIEALEVKKLDATSKE